MIPASMKGPAETYLGGNTNDAVVAVPATSRFPASGHQGRGDYAWFNMMRSINELTAAALHMVWTEEGIGERNVLIYGMGEGTCDVSLPPLDSKRKIAAGLCRQPAASAVAHQCERAKRTLSSHRLPSRLTLFSKASVLVLVASSTRQGALHGLLRESMGIVESSPTTRSRTGPPALMNEDMALQYRAQSSQVKDLHKDRTRC